MIVVLEIFASKEVIMRKAIENNMTNYGQKRHKEVLFFS